jgi:SAM-dependent methyltransferase
VSGTPAGPQGTAERLARLRARFLDATEIRGPLADYWLDDEDLAAYEAVFAARIGWKWDAVVDELAERGFARADADLVVDWGCGTGIAARRFAARFGAGRIVCHDRSPRAAAFAVARAREALPAIPAEAVGTCAGLRPDLLLISHVLDELDARAEVELLELVERSARVVWVEPGSRALSRLLSAHRDRLRGTFRIVAPCPHQGPCSVLAAEDRQHWCHFFAKAPAEVFTDGTWVRLGRELGIDLRALPYAFVALARDRAADLPAAAARLLGRPDVGNKEARAWLCAADGLQAVRVFKGRDRTTHRALKKGEHRLWLRSPGGIEPLGP